jgi:hypothetical protein
VNHVLDSLFKFILFLIFAPVLLCVALQILMGFLAFALPWFILGSAVAGLVAGVSAALVLRRRLPPQNGDRALPPAAPPLGPYRVRRPRGR